MKRIVLYIVTNLAVLVMLSVVARLLGLDTLLARRGIDMASLLTMAAVIGFTGSLISLAISKWSAKHLLGVRVIGQPATIEERWLRDTVTLIDSALSGSREQDRRGPGPFTS